MKILNKNKKLKYSKMFIDKEVYSEICKKYGSLLEDHLSRVSKGMEKEQDSYVPEMVDISIIFELYSRITKVIKPRRVKRDKERRSSSDN